MTENNINVEQKLLETELIFVVDKSRSMYGIAQATVDGINTFIREQKAAEGKAFVTMVQFDDRYEMLYKSCPIEEVNDLVVGETYVPRGNTALLDAIGKTINELETTRDVVFVILTDGHENDSKVYKREAIKNMITSLENEKQWKFIYMGANQNAITVGSDFGIKASNAMTYKADNEHVTMAFMSASSNIGTMRSAKSDYFSRVASGQESYSTAAMDSLTDETLGFSADQRDSSLK